MNSDVIHYLPDTVANQIAAGEVIQRPASVVKELVENSIDAGASSVTIVVKDAGRTLIQIIDNGCGMSPTDARMAFERHATSKITKASDLSTLRTMGFRGEALPSVAVISQIDLRTMRRGDSIGTRLRICGEKFEGSEPVSTVPGTNIMVKNLFFNVPARRKFLKKDSIELSHILHEFERQALVNTSVEFSLLHNDVAIHQFPASNLKQRIGALFGKPMESQLAPLLTETSLVKISGFISQPKFAKKRGQQQFFFVNGRYMRHLPYHKTIMRCYEQLIAAGSQPSYFINFELDPASIDVNIHPQKYEIKFENEFAIIQILEAAVREALGNTAGTGTLDFDNADAPEIPLFAPDATVGVPADDDNVVFGETLSFSSDNSPFSGDGSSQFATTAPAPRRAVSSTDKPDWEQLYENFARRRDEGLAAMSTPDEPSAEETDASSGSMVLADDSTDDFSPSPCFQLAGKYIVTATTGGLMLINQHRAHIRILYERWLRQLADRSIESQQLIFADDIEIAASQGAVLEANAAIIENLGFRLIDNGGGRWSITGAPALPARVSPRESLLAVLDELSCRGDADADTLRAPVALAMARSAAVKAGQRLKTSEMENIIAELFRCDSPNHTPDGHPVLSIISSDDISRLFQ